MEEDARNDWDGPNLLSSSDSDNELLEDLDGLDPPPRQAEPLENRPRRVERIALYDFIRMVAGNRNMEQAVATTNEELVQNLRQGGVITSDSVYKAMLACPRGTFIPVRYADEAYHDEPIRVEEHDFNISAPHMHATCLEALSILPGDSVLDVGCGCGYVTSCMAYLTGTAGRVVGIDTRPACVNFSREHVTRLAATNDEFQDVAGVISWELHNVFMPSARHREQYDKVHVGASCPNERVAWLLQLIKPGGGKVVVPVGSELRLITKAADGSVQQRVLSTVRFSDLDLPTDAEVVVAALEDQSRAAQRVEVPPSTYLEDLRHVVGGTEQVPPASPSHPQWAPAASELMGALGGLLGAPDCSLVGSSWTLPAHKAVLRARCEHFRARFDSGMRDAHDGELLVPDDFTQQAMKSFLRYIYRDDAPEGLEAELVMQLMHIAAYYGCSRLMDVCEALLAAEVLRGVTHSPAAGGGEVTAEARQHALASVLPLLSLAHEQGLSQLKRVAVNFVVDNYEAVSGQEEYGSLHRDVVDLICKEMWRRHAATQALLKELSVRVTPPTRVGGWLANIR